MKTTMHHGAYGNLFSPARTLRNQLTLAEKILWEELRGKQIGVKFRRQHPLLKFVVDFYSHQVKLIIEVDGSSHENSTRQQEDQEKDFNLRTAGFHLIRFTNEQVINHTEQVMWIIKNFIDCLLCQEKS